MDQSITEPLLTVPESEPVLVSENIGVSEKFRVYSESLENMDVSEKETASAKASAPAPENESLIDLQKSAEPFSQAIDALKKIAVENYVNVEKSSLRGDTMTEEFNLVDIEKEIKIINSIETLKNMGYSDDGGWLTRLVSAKYGNINAVLDAISPNVTPRK